MLKAQPFIASDEVRLSYYRWDPISPPQAIIHILHGMAEHAGRYARVAQSLTAIGYLVFALDLRGHGQSAPQQQDLGYFAEQNGWERVVQDVKEFLAHTQPARLPTYLLGHSMGSYLAQQIIYEAPSLLAGAVLSAPNGKPKFLVQAGRAIARAERARRGKRGRSQLIHSLTFGKFNEGVPEAETPFDWLSRDRTEVKLYFNDARCGFLCTTQLWVDFLDGIVELANPVHKNKIPKNFPIYIFAGDHDPVCDRGRGAILLANEYRAAGLRNVSYKIYPEGRHEMLNEVNREEVMNDLVNWLRRGKA